MREESHCSPLTARFPWYLTSVSPSSLYFHPQSPRRLILVTVRHAANCATNDELSNKVNQACSVAANGKVRFSLFFPILTSRFVPCLTPKPALDPHALFTSSQKLHDRLLALRLMFHRRPLTGLSTPTRVQWKGFDFKNVVFRGRPLFSLCSVSVLLF